MEHKPNTKLLDFLIDGKAKAQKKIGKHYVVLDVLRLAENVKNPRLATWRTESEDQSFESD